MLTMYCDGDCAWLTEQVTADTVTSFAKLAHFIVFTESDAEFDEQDKYAIAEAVSPYFETHQRKVDRN